MANTVYKTKSMTEKNTGKNIVIFSDGTGQEGGVRQNTNVYRLFNMIEDGSKDQIAFYDEGLGTMGNKVLGNLSGFGISKNIIDCYRFISDNHQWGDRVFLFGFSRGATTVRSLSGFISEFGLLPNSRPNLIDRAYEIYRMSTRTPKKKAKKEQEKKEFLRLNRSSHCDIKFLGVWDTVAALGLPIKAVNALLDRISYFKHSFHNLALASSVHHGYHALSIDDDRRVFHPTPWFIRDQEGQSLLKPIAIDPMKHEFAGQEKCFQTVQQVWFCGSHTDIGGGYESKGISDIPLSWMFDKAMEHGLKRYDFHPVEVKQDIEAKIHDPRSSLPARMIYRQETRKWDVAKCGKPVIHASVLERQRIDKSYDPWILKKFPQGMYIEEPWGTQELQDYSYLES